jgi:hypothetical protein
MLPGTAWPPVCNPADRPDADQYSPVVRSKRGGHQNGNTAPGLWVIPDRASRACVCILPVLAEKRQKWGTPRRPFAVSVAQRWGFRSQFR